MTRKFLWLPDTPDHRDHHFMLGLKLTLPLPPAVDLRPLCPDVYDQLNLGSCTAQAIAAALPERIGKLVDIGTGTGSLLELLAERTEHALGLDASREMLALARARLAERGIADHCAVRQADMYRLPLADASQDVATMQMVLHYAEEPAAAIAEAARVLRADGVLLIVDLAQHQRADITARHAHRWPGFDDGLMAQWLDGAGCALRQSHEVPGTIAVRLWTAQRLLSAVTTPEPAFQL
jgi:ArsR family transcriptional regulator